jgi:hypothetical protein
MLKEGTAVFLESWQRLGVQVAVARRGAPSRALAGAQ